MICPICHGTGEVPARSTYVMPSERPHVPSEWLVNGWRLHLAQGGKGPKDVVISVASPGGNLVRLSLTSLGAITSLWYRNEDRLYPNGSGGRMVLSYLESACQAGIESAAALYRLPKPVVVRVDPKED